MKRLLRRMRTCDDMSKAADGLEDLVDSLVAVHLLLCSVIREGVQLFDGEGVVDMRSDRGWEPSEVHRVLLSRGQTLLFDEILTDRHELAVVDSKIVPGHAVVRQRRYMGFV